MSLKKANYFYENLLDLYFKDDYDDVHKICDNLFYYFDKSDLTIALTPFKALHKVGFFTIVIREKDLITTRYNFVDNNIILLYYDVSDELLSVNKKVLSLTLIFDDKMEEDLFCDKIDKITEFYF
jgi:hypothetical protein